MPFEQNRAINEAAFIGRDLGTVTILRKLGQGAMATVFLGFQRTLNRQVVVKVLSKSEGTTDITRKLFRHEAQMVAQLNHPNIIPIFEMGEGDDCYYMVMQVVHGEDLESLITRRYAHPLPSKRVLPLVETIHLVVGALEGLGFAHSEGVVHQDIKPANILVEEKQKRPLIGDFGIAKTRQREIKQEGVIVGSPLYMAPEQVSGVSTDHRADIYSMGVLLFKMCCGDLPVVSTDVMEILARKMEEPDTIFTKKPSEASAQIDARLERIICTAMAADPSQRFQSCKAMQSDLEEYRTRFA